MGREKEKAERSKEIKGSFSTVAAVLNAKQQPIGQTFAGRHETSSANNRRGCTAAPPSTHPCSSEAFFTGTAQSWLSHMLIFKLFSHSVLSARGQAGVSYVLMKQ